MCKSCICMYVSILAFTHSDGLCVCVKSADDFSERSLRLAEVSRDQRNLEEEEEEEASPIETKKGKRIHGYIFNFLSF